MRALLPLACGLLVTLSTVAAPSMAQAEVPDAGLPALWKGLQETAGQGLQDCVEQARLEALASWTCMGGALTTVDDKARPVTRIISTDVEYTSATDGTFAILADDYDTWCESSSVCARKISSTIAEVKGNGAYGDLTGVIGEFDLIIRQAFDGQWPRWRNTLIWDSGPMILPQEFSNNCRINQIGPDGHCGEVLYNFATVSSTSWKSQKPSATTYYYNSQKTSNSSNYHDDNYGSFRAVGYPNLTFYASTLHTGRWNQCNTSSMCKYYQAPWA